MRRLLGLLVASCLSIPPGAEAAAYSLSGSVRVRVPVSGTVVPLNLSTVQPAAHLSLQSPAAFSLVPQTLVTAPLLQDNAADLSAGQDLRTIGSSREVALASTLYFDGALTPKPSPSAFGFDRANLVSGLRKAGAGAQSLRRAVGPQSPVEKRVRRWVWPGIAVGAAIPVLFKAAPFHFLGYLLPAAAALPIAVLLGLGLFRLVRHLRGRTPAAKPAGRPATWRSAVVGLALGLSLVVGAVKFEGPILEKAAAVAMPGLELRHVPGAALESEVILQLKESERGRTILDHVRDRSGVLRIPQFFVVKEDGTTLATYNSITDGIFIASDEITKRGWTIEQFLSDPSIQREFARDFQHTFAHELMHANQARRSILTPGQFKAHFDLEWEYEANIEEHFHLHERLRDDPLIKLSDHDLRDYIMAIRSLDGYLKNLRGRETYKDLPRSQDPYFDHYFAKLRAGWPAHQVEGLTLLGKRALPTRPLAAAAYFEQALALADSLRMPVRDLPLSAVHAYTRHADSTMTLKPVEARASIDKALAITEKHWMPTNNLLARKVESYIQEAKLLLATSQLGNGIFLVDDKLDAAAALADSAGISRPDLAALWISFHVELARYWAQHGHPGFAQLDLDKAARIAAENGLPFSMPSVDSLKVKTP